jgi:hypothetical protein
VPINVLCFQIFSHGTEQLLSRSWLLDPVRTQVSVAATLTGPSEPWNGEFYASLGEGNTRSWTDAMQYGFISAGGGSWYSKTLNLLKPEDRVWVKVPGTGFVGVGRVTGGVQPARTFRVSTSAGDALLIDVANGGDYHRELLDDL